MILKKILRILAVLFALICLLLAALSWAVSTEEGTKQLFKLASKLTHHELTYQEVKGNLLSQLEVYNFQYQGRDIAIHVEQVYLNWHPIDLLQKKVTINSLTINNVMIDRHTVPKNETKPAQQLSLKNWRLHIKQLALNHLSYREDKNEKWRLQKLSGTVDIGSQLSAHLTAINTLPIPITAQFKVIGNWQDYSWGLSLENAATTNLTLSGVGNLQSTTFKIEDPTNHFFGGTIQSNGEIEWSPQWQWHVSLQTQKVNLPVAELGALSFQLATVGNPQNVNLELSDIQSNYRHTPLTGYLKLKARLPSGLTDAHSDDVKIKTILQQAQLQIDSNLQLGLLQATILGELDQRWNMHFKIQVPELSKVTNTVKGSLRLNGSIIGDPIAPDITADIDGQDMVLTQFPSAIFKGKLKLNTALLPKGHACDYSSLNLAHSPCSFQLHAILSTSDLALKTDGHVLHFPLTGDLNSDFSPAGLAANLHLLLFAKPFLSAQLTLPDFKLGQKLSANQPVNGNLSARLNQSQLGNYQVPIVKNLQAGLTADLKIAGRVDHPQVSGNATLLSPSMRIPDYNLNLTQTKLVLSAQGDKLDYTGASYSGGGNIQLKGQSLFRDQKMVSNLTLTGQKFLVSDTRQIKLYVSPNLKVHNTDQGWYIAGVIDVPKASVNIPDTSNVVTLPSETVVITSNQQKTEQTNPLGIFINVLIRLGQDIQVSGRGFVGKLGGAVTINESPGHARLADGEIKVTKGAYHIHGDELNIDHGYARFDNSLLENPFLDIQASKLIKFHEANQTTFDSSDLRVGARVTGTANQPIIKLFSDPADWSQADILSFLILGQPASVSSGPNLQLLMRTAQLLKSGNSSNLDIGSIQKNLQNTLGLTEFDFVSGTNTVDGGQQSSNSFVVGKAITPRLSINYSIGILNAVNTLRLKYLVSKHWFLQTDSSDQGNGADIVYSIKKK